jgi:hypothetical protein
MARFSAKYIKKVSSVSGIGINRHLFTVDRQVHPSVRHDNASFNGCVLS